MSEKPKSISKTDLMTTLAEKAGLTKQQVSAVFDELSNVVRDQIGPSGPGVFVLPNLVKITVAEKPAKPETTKPNPFKPGEMMTVKAKPASRKIKVAPVKALKDLA